MSITCTKVFRISRNTMLVPRYGFLLAVSGCRQCPNFNRSAQVSVVKGALKTIFGKYLLVTNTLTAGALMFVGDLIQQELEYQERLIPKRYDYGRLYRMTVVALGQGVLQHYYYTWLTRAIPARTVPVVIGKIVLDQCVMAPLYISTFFHGMGLLEGQPLSASANELKTKFWEIYRVDCIVWPPAQFINFYIVPDRFQVIYINSITLVYNAFLSCVKHKQFIDDELNGSATSEK